MYLTDYRERRSKDVITQVKPGFFEKLIIDKLGQQAAGHIKLDWANPRVICIAESYSKFDIDTAEVVPLLRISDHRDRPFRHRDRRIRERDRPFR